MSGAAINTACSALAKEAAVKARATAETTLLLKRRPNRPLIAAPISGSSGISQSLRSSVIDSVCLQFQQVHAVDVQRLACAENGDDDGQAHGGFRRGNHHDKKDEDVAAEFAQRL